MGKVLNFASLLLFGVAINAIAGVNRKVDDDSKMMKENSENTGNFITGMVAGIQNFIAGFGLMEKKVNNTFKALKEEKKYKTIISADTAGSAKELSDGKDNSIAAIASKLSAKIYKLKILKENIEDEKGNVTRFLIMGKNVQQPEYKKGKKYITTCIFRLKSEPAALYKSLGGFATNQVNMTKLESFSVKNTFAQTNFYLDFEGHLDDKLVQNAMEKLGFHTETLDILGVYEASKFREK